MNTQHKDTSRSFREIKHRLLAESGTDGIMAYLDVLEEDFLIDGTQTKLHCYYIAFDAEGRILKTRLINYLVTKICDYAATRKERQKVHKMSTEAGGTLTYHIQLQNKVKDLFIKSEKSKKGEPGEFLLYILAEQILELPQLFTKMAIKTAQDMPVHGADAVHFDFDDEAKKLHIYWGESKMYSNAYQAMRDCITGIKRYLVNSPFSQQGGQREMVMISERLQEQIADTEIVNIIYNYFFERNKESRDIINKGICFVGYDSNSYKAAEDSQDESLRKSMIEELHKEVINKTKTFAKHLKENNLDIKDIHLFLIPFSSTTEFSENFLSAL